MSRRKRISLLSLVLCLFALVVTVHAQDEASEYDGTDYMLKPENNKASMSFPVPGTPMDEFFQANNYIRAFTIMPEPIGTTDYVGGKENQIAGNSGFHFRLPTTLAGKPITQHAITGFSTIFVLTRDLLGDERFVALLAEATRRHEAGENMGDWFTPKDSSFLKAYDLCIYMRFQDGAVRNITQSGVAMVGINLSDAQNGNLPVSYGAVAIDQNATDDQWHKEERVELGAETLSLIYDGIADGVLDVTWWIADTRAAGGSSGSSGCNAAAPLTTVSLLLVFGIFPLSRRFRR